MRFGWLLILFPCLLFAQQEKMYQIPESQLTEQQKAKLQQTTPTQVHEWVGLGREIGEAINSSLSAVTTQANNFAQTPVGKLTVVMVMWKVLGSDAYHFVAGMIELAIFVPIFLWSYRKTCMPRRAIVASEGPLWNRKRTYQMIPYDKNRDFSPRHGHCIILAVFTFIWCITMFSGS